MDAFSYVFIVVVLLVISIRIWQTFFIKNRSLGVKKEGWTFPVVVVMYNLIIIGTILEYILITKEINFKVSIVGFLLGGLGLFITVSSIRSLGRFWGLSIEIKKNHEIVKSGLYHYIRHPYYMGVIFEITGFILFANSYYMFILAFLLFSILIFRVMLEERVMNSVFGEEYEKYKGEVSAFFPSSSFLRMRKGEQKELNSFDS